MDVYWLEQAAADLPEADDWLSLAETVRLGAMQFAKRQADWRLGRWTAKRAVAACLNMSTDPETLARIEIRAAPSGAPRVLLADQPAAVTISISHRAERAACAVARAAAALGCDLEVIEERSAAFAADYFTVREQALIEQAVPPDRWRLLALLWSAKESALKALGAGLRLDTRSVTITPCRAWQENSAEWRSLGAHCDSGQLFQGWWQQTGSLLRTVMAAPPCDMPILL